MEMKKDQSHVSEMQNILLRGIRSRLPDVQLNGPEPGPQRYSGNINLSFPHVELRKCVALKIHFTRVNFPLYSAGVYDLHVCLFSF